MKLLVPASLKNLAARSLWFKTPEALKLSQEKNVEFGFEIKGGLSTITRRPDLYWGVHLPNDFATVWYHEPKKRKQLIKQVKKVAKLKPAYAVLHGINFSWTPPEHGRIHRYYNYLGSAEYLKMLRSYNSLIRELKSILPIKVENQAICEAYLKGTLFVPQTHLYLGTNRLMDILDTAKKTKIDILLDSEHLLITLNFLNRKQNYSKLAKEKLEGITEEDRKASKISGYAFKKYFMPYAEKPISYEAVIKKFKPKYFHVTGSTQDVIPGKRIANHAPITRDSKTFRKIIRPIVAQKPEVIVSEVADGTMGKSWKHLKKNEGEISFRELCGILQEEL